MARSDRVFRTVGIVHGALLCCSLVPEMEKVYKKKTKKQYGEHCFNHAKKIGVCNHLDSQSWQDFGEGKKSGELLA